MSGADNGGRGERAQCNSTPQLQTHVTSRSCLALAKVIMPISTNLLGSYHHQSAFFSPNQRIKVTLGPKALALGIEQGKFPAP